MLIETLAENERLSAVNQAQCRFFELESRNTWRTKIGNIMAKALTSPVLFSRLPFLVMLTRFKPIEIIDPNTDSKRCWSTFNIFASLRALAFPCAGISAT